MKINKLYTYEKMLFELLRASLHQDKIETILFENVTPNDWKECYEASVKQGVMALAWDGVVKLPTTLLPPKALKLAWALSVESYEKKYEKYCQTAEELIEFYKQKDIATVQLKGVGLSAYYPIPNHREGGDIDIYTYSANKEYLSDSEANLLADKLMLEKNIAVVNDHSEKHSSFYYNGISIENHRTFLDVEWYNIAPQTDKFLRTILKPKEILLLNGKYRIIVPSAEFNKIYVAFHAAQHFGSGLALHHLCDWAMIIKNHGIILPKEIRDKHFLEGIAAFTQLCNQYLGTNVNVKGGEKLASEVLEAILHPQLAYKTELPIGKINILIYKIRRMFYTTNLSNRILYMPMWKRIWISIKTHIQHPKKLFT